MAANTTLSTHLNLPSSVFTYIQAVAERFPIEKAYIFGSYSSGTAQTDSDIDIAIVSSAFVGNHFTDDVQLGLVKLNIDRRIAPVGFRPEMFNESDMLADEILRQGQELPLEVFKTGVDVSISFAQMSEHVLARDWNRKEEDEAWHHLQAAQ